MIVGPDDALGTVDIEPAGFDRARLGRFTSRSRAYIGSVNLAARLVDRLAAFGQVIVVAAALGTTAQADVFFLAAIAPLTVGTIVGEPLGRALFGVLLRARDPHEGVRVAAAGFAASGVVGGALTGLYLAAALPLVAVFAPAGSDDLVPWLVFAALAPALALGAYLSTVLLWLEQYGWAALRFPLASGASLLLLVLATVLTDGVAWTAAAVSAAHVVMLAVLFARVSRELGAGWVLRVTRPALEQAFAVRWQMASPFAGGLVGGQVIVLVERALASALAAGTVATLSYARGIAGAPTVVSQAIGAAAYPGLVRAEFGGSLREMRGLFLGGLRLNVLVGVVFAAYLALFGDSVTAFVLQRGEFGIASSERASDALLAFSLSTLGTSLLMYLVTVLYGIGAFSGLLYRSLVVFSAYAVLAPLLLLALGATGLALAYSLAQMVGAVFAVELIARRLELSNAELLRGLVPIAPAVTAILVPLALYRALLIEVDVPTQWRGLVGVVASAVLLVLATAAALFARELPETQHLRQRLSTLRRRAE
jgi:putative peptidoglycan lipid II flippase